MTEMLLMMAMAGGDDNEQSYITVECTLETL